MRVGTRRSRPRTEVGDHVVTIAYNRPHMADAINGDMRDALNTQWERFCGGADLRDGMGSTGTFAGVNGACIG